MAPLKRESPHDHYVKRQEFKLRILALVVVGLVFFSNAVETYYCGVTQTRCCKCVSYNRLSNRFP